MTTPLWCLMGFVGWTLLLLLALGVWRGALVLGQGAKAGDFLAGVPHGGARYWRLNRAHLNCTENLPLFASVVLIGAVIGADSPTLDRLASVFLLARVAQSSTHIASGSDFAVNVRFSFFLVQLACLIWMAFLIFPARAV